MLKKITLFFVFFTLLNNIAIAQKDFLQFSEREKEDFIAEIILDISELKEEKNDSLKRIKLNIVLEKFKEVGLLKNIDKKTREYREFSYVFKKGVKDSITRGEVSQLQEKLKADGFLDDIIDGYVGPKTAAAIERMKNKKNISDSRYGEFNPNNLKKINTDKKTYEPEKIIEFLSSDQIEFYNINFPFKKEDILNVSCNDADKKFSFQNKMIIFPISFSKNKNIKKVSCRLNWDFGKKEKTFLIIYRKEIKRELVNIKLNKISTKTYIKPSQSNITRTTREAKLLKETYKNADRNTVFSNSFIKPISSYVTSSFGKTRIFNGQRKSYHNGTDFKAKIGEKIVAINDGEVLLAQNLFYCGNTIIINHGFNIFSTYCHMSKINVKSGDSIKRGDVVGLSGMTGRVSGPHLHLSIKYDNNGIFQYIDFLDMVNKSEILK